MKSAEHPNYVRRRRRPVGPGRRADQGRVRGQPGQPDRHLDPGRRGAAAATSSCPSRSSWCSTAPMTKFAAMDPDHDGGLALARESTNLVVTRTFSKLYGLASQRIGWGYFPQRHGGRDRAHAPAVQHHGLGPGGGAGGAVRRRLRGPLHRAGRDLAALAGPADRRPGARGLSVADQLRPGAVPRDAGPHRQGGRGPPGRRGDHRARPGQLRHAELPAHHHRPGRAQPRRGRLAGPLRRSSRAEADVRGHLSAPGGDRLRPDRLLGDPRRPRRRRGRRPSPWPMPAPRTAPWSRRSAIADLVTASPEKAVEERRPDPDRHPALGHRPGGARDRRRA